MSAATRLFHVSNRGRCLGMACAVWSAVLLLYAADYVFTIIGGPRAASRDFFMWPRDVIWFYCTPIWFGVSVFVVASLILAFRNRGIRSWVFFNLCVLIVCVGFALLVRQTAYDHFGELNRIGTRP